jgi:chloramphenicol 3-O phosphotransferase
MTGMPGHLIALVGTSSVGKSTTARRLQLLLDEPHLVVGLDHFYDMFPSDWGGHRRGPGPGFWQETVTDDDSKPRIITYYGDAGERLLAGMRAAVVALLDAGNDVILDEMPVDDTVMPAWRRVLAAYDVWWVALHAPLDVIEQREDERNHGRHIGNARGHYGYGMDGEFDLVVDAAALTPDERAAAVAQVVSGSGRP